ncbi:tetratricopeptide repeat protein [Nocardiopsis halotolerans]|uniref:tetratricopeptide repeat protein n=1 Tax=Nocardiopsis halotolerans TaxID=124252 RepID=UPI0003497CAA|nr:tetratricopeptide repeat protein [Nocardiopsis halotolerans]
MTHTSNNPQNSASSIELRWIKAGRDVIGHQQVIHLPRPNLAALHTLPPPPATLVGRAEPLKELLTALDPTPANAASSSENTGGSHEEHEEQGRAHGSVGRVVAVLAGMGGVGKSALALAASAIAHHEQWFCAELFVDLRGYAPGTEPLSAEVALDVLLRQMGVDPKDIPPGVQERASFYRSALQSLSASDEQGRPVLMVADNASSASQVRPLLPGVGEHRLVATSRGGLHSLAGARHLDLDVLDLESAITLLASDLISHTPEDQRAEDEAGLGRLAGLCGLLPLALEIAAAYLKRSPRLTPNRLADRLEQAVSRVDKLKDPDRDAGQARVLRAVFDASLGFLDRTEAEVFLLVASTPGPTLGTAAAATLTDLPLEEVEEVLEELAAAHLLTQPTPGRWGAHDLLSDYARHHPHPPSGRDQALGRLLDHYTTTTSAANDHLEALPGQLVPDLFSGSDAALAWLDAERTTLVAAALAAPALGDTDAAIALPLHLNEYLYRGRYFEDLEQVLRSAQATARATGDHMREGRAWNYLGTTLRQVRRFNEAIEALTHARDLSHQIGNVHGEAAAWTNLGTALTEVRRFDEAIHALTHARDLHHQTGDQADEAATWNNLGTTLRQVRRFDESIQAHTRALNLYQQIGHTHGEAAVWTNLGTALRQVRRFDEAIHALTQARDMQQQLTDAHGEAQAWTNLGTALRETGRFKEAIDALTHACETFDKLGDAHEEATAWTNLGVALAQVGKPTEAVHALTRARDLYDQTGDVNGEAQAGANLGMALAQAGQPTEAIHNLTRAREAFNQTGDVHGEAQLWNNLGLVLLELGQQADAVRAVQRAVDLFEATGDEHKAALGGELLRWIQQDADADDPA